MNLKPDDPAWAELISDIKAVVSTRFAEDPDAIFSPEYVPAGKDEPGFEFAVLNRKDQQAVLADTISWRHYENQGISQAQQEIIFGNVIDGKPQEQWLDGVFDEKVLEDNRIRAFKASVEDMRNSPDNHVFEEMDGDRVPWDKLSAAAKLQYIVGDAARTEAPFKAFAEVARDVIGDDSEAALRIVLEGQKELHGIAKLLPDDVRTEPTPLVEQVKEVLDYVAILEQEHFGDQEAQEKERKQDTDRRLEGAEALRDILRGDHSMPQDLGLPERDGGATRVDILKPDDPAWAELMADIKAVVSSRPEDGFAFTSLHRTEQWDFFTTSGFYGPYRDRGMTDTQITRIIRNAIDGQPQEKWLEGVFDSGRETPAFADILNGSGKEPEPPRQQEQGGREM